MASDLLQQFESIAKEHNRITARIDEAIATIPEAMAECARQLTEQGKELPSFGKSYELYRQKYEALENAPEAPLGFSAFVDKPPMPSDKNFASQMPVVEASNEPIYEDSLVEDIEEWTAYIVDPKNWTGS
ncbi:hypothetical protein IQ241_21250 [Romeria aff. gracilis LEGE 07310]|uniref:Uncharacterized protein n=1 Tax=Vasconcelosia minhoensis LEGE 07310 TaxID=915328 RepID=A0A8J7AY47_9CYAN|nr:hypothetical protein [Romeria gracilis]MBE9079788.1 hypothetical protein [Romeria aff. gracilis LEGE 07310]